MLRAGLFYLVLFFAVLIGTAAPAPLPERPSSFVESSDYNANELAARTLAVLLHREHDISNLEHIKREYISTTLDDRELSVYSKQYTKREHDSLFVLYARDFQGLERTFTMRRDFDVEFLRRRSFWDRMRNAFRHAGNAISNSFHKAQATFQKAGGAIRNGFQRVRAGFQKATGAMRSGFQRVGGVMRNGFQKVGAGFGRVGGAMRNGFGKVGQGLRTAGATMRNGLAVAGTAIKNNIATAAKIGLKAYAAYATVASKIVKFVPGVGSALSKVMKGVAMGANEASKLIPTHLSGNLEKALEGMDYVISPMDSIGKLVGGGKAAKALEVVDQIF